MKQRATLALRAVPSAVLSLLVLSGPGFSTDLPDLGGVWTLNEELSENPREKIFEMMKSRGGGGGGGKGGGGMGGGGRGGGGMGGSGGDMPDPEEMRRRIQELGDSVRTVEIIQEGPWITMRYADGRERKLQADGKKHLREGGIGDVETQAKWKNDGRLVVKLTTEQGRKIKETYRLGTGGVRMYVDVEIEGDGRAMQLKFRRVYDWQDPEPGDGDPAASGN